MQLAVTDYLAARGITLPHGTWRQDDDWAWVILTDLPDPNAMSSGYIEIIVTATVCDGEILQVTVTAD